MDYSLMTPFSSFLVLESEEAYQQLGIPRTPRDPLWGLVPQAVLETMAGAPLALFGCNSDSPDTQREQLERTRVYSVQSPPAGRGSAASLRPGVPRPQLVGAAARLEYLAGAGPS
ncbi:MAG: hypothetical protein IPG96_09130 [Proteobacteria bacterium]|nr:hypothetical protein [Pseudomonadota bacterium]